MTTASTALPALLLLRPNDLINTGYDKIQAFKRAIKVFQLSYAGILNMDLDLHKNFSDAYKQEMLEIYGFSNMSTNDIDLVYKEVDKELKREIIEIKIGILRAKGMDELTSPTVLVNSGLPKTRSGFKIAIKKQNEKQTENPFKGFTSFQELRKVRLQNKSIQINFETKPQMSNFRSFELPYREIHAEGFENWFDFRNGVELLIKVSISAIGMNPNEAIDFHMHSILYVIQSRLKVYQSYRNPINLRHQTSGAYRKTTAIRKRVDPNTESAFWSTPITSLLFDQSVEEVPDQELLDYVRSRLRFDRNAFPSDLQIENEFFDEVSEENFCICNEWCNLNAFFYYNPIIRFLMVGHNRIYMRNKTNIPNLYECITTYLLRTAITRTPLQSLLNSAHEYSQRNYLRSISDSKYKAIYKAIVHNPQPLVLLSDELIGQTYLMLRRDVRPALIRLETDINLFLDSSIENIRQFYKVFNDLHIRVAEISSYVDRNYIDLWFLESNYMSHKWYNIYIQLCYERGLDITKGFHGFDHLFTEDYEYTSRRFEAEGTGTKEVTHLRNYIKRFSEDIDQNPYNVKFVCNSFIMTMIHLNKFIQRVGTLLPSLKDKTTHKAKEEFWVKFDEYLRHYSQTVALQLILYSWTFRLLESSPSEQMKRQLNFWYTLKNYSVAFGIQKNIIYSVVDHNNFLVIPEKLATNDLEFIYRNEWIEHTFRYLYQEVLFQKQQQFQQVFDAFYGNFWGKADHEINQNLLQNEFIDSVGLQYMRLYFWWKNDGNNRTIFQNILVSLDKALEDIIQRSESIFSTEILLNFQALNVDYEYNMEVIDQLVYYLVKAICFMIVSTVTDFLKQIHLLQDKALTTVNKSFTLCKPGFVPLFRTFKKCLNYIELLKSRYIAFDNEFKRIARVLNQTKLMIKGIYGDFYKKLVVELHREIELVLNTFTQINSDQNVLVMKLHICVGTSFMAAFIDDFRSQSFRFRRRIQNLHDAPNTKRLVGQALIDTWNVCLKWLKQRDEIERALPFQSQLWQNFFATEFEFYDMLDETFVNIDLSATD